MDNSTLYEMIDRRVSRRSYLDTAVSAEARQALQAHIDAVNREAGLALNYVDDGAQAFDGFTRSYGLFSGVRSYIAMVGETGDPHLDEKAGYFGEQLVLAATALDLGTCWVGGSFDRKSSGRGLKPGERLVCVITVGVVPAQRSWRENLVRGAMHRRIRSVEMMSTCDSQPPEWFLRGMRAVQKAPSAVNRQPVHFTLRQGAVTAGVPDIGGLNLVDLGIAKLHFEIGAGGRFSWGNGAAFTRPESASE